MAATWKPNRHHHHHHRGVTSSSFSLLSTVPSFSLLLSSRPFQSIHFYCCTGVESSSGLRWVHRRRSSSLKQRKRGPSSRQIISQLSLNFRFTAAQTSWSWSYPNLASGVNAETCVFALLLCWRPLLCCPVPKTTTLEERAQAHHIISLPQIPDYNNSSPPPHIAHALDLLSGHVFCPRRIQSAGQQQP